MKRLFVPSNRLTPPRARLDGPEVRHLRALRLRPGARLTVFDDRAREYESVLLQIDAKSAVLQILRARAVTVESGPAITLVAAVLKGQRMDFLVEKATELGVRRIVPVLTERTVARPRRPQGPRTDRWKRVAISASKQCGRAQVPDVEPTVPFGDVIAARSEGALKVLLWELESESRLTSLRSSVPPPSEIVLAVGPEGGFSDQEVSLAREAGFEVCGLGSRTMRAETAAMVGVALCQSLWGDMSG